MDGQNGWLEISFRMRHPGARLQMAGVRVEEHINPALARAPVSDLMVRIANNGKRKFPVALRFCSQRLRFRCDSNDSATSRANLLDDSGLNVASKLEATGRSPQPAVVEQQHKLMVSEYFVQPSATCSFGRVQQWRNGRGLLRNQRKPVAVREWRYTHLLTGADFAITKHEVYFKGLIGFVYLLGPDHACQLKRRIVLAVEPVNGVRRYGAKVYRNVFYHDGRLMCQTAR